jgi:hypothetical protein
MRRASALALLLLLLAVPAAPAAGGTEEPPRLAAQLTGCATAVDPAGRTAEFTGSMPALAGTDRMAMRFDLFQRRGRGAFRRIATPGLGEWERSEPGRGGFVFTKRVEFLAAPASYRAVVRFRWYDADGALQRAALRRTPVCRQPDPRPQLRVVALEPAPEGGYRATVENTGRGGASAFATTLTVGGEAQAPRRIEGLAAGDVAVLVLAGPPCPPGGAARVEVDSGREVAEAVERDNARTVPCAA